MQARAVVPIDKTVRFPTAAERDVIEAVWARSQDADEPAGRPRNGWWSVTDWATAVMLLTDADTVFGFAAIEHQRGAETAEARIGLLLAWRESTASACLIQATLNLAQATGAPTLRLYTPAAAEWAISSARDFCFQPVRTQHIMVRPAHNKPLLVSPPSGVQIRPIRSGEEEAVLHALNHAWATTWNARPITAEVLAQDLVGQQAGMLVAIDERSETIIGTCHALFDHTGFNPDGNSYAWISNLTTDPAWRGRGLGRALLAAGVQFLLSQGACSIALGVDGSAVAPMQLYLSAGFATISTVELWERAVGCSPAGGCEHSWANAGSVDNL